MMEYYLRDVTSLPDPREKDAALSGIPGWRQEQILKYLRPSDRKLCLGAWRLLEDTLEGHGFSADDVTIGENGKLECQGVYFNLSHSVDMALCVISSVPVGCDIEKVADAPMEIAQHVFCERERDYIAGGQREEERDHRFFRLWTMKESYMKMTGEGMNLSPERIEIAFDTWTVLRDSVPQSCILQNVTLDEYEISICMDEEGFDA